MKYISIIAATIAMMLSTSCSNSKEQDPPAAASVPLEVNVGIGSISQSKSAVPGTEFVNESIINVMLTDFALTTTNYNTSGIYTYKKQSESGVWQPQNIDTPLQLSSKDAMVLAHYPATLPIGASFDVATKVYTPVVKTALAFGDLLQGEYNADNSFPFSFKQDAPQTEIFIANGEIDYMYGKMTNETPVNATQKSAQINMQHGLSMIVFNTFKSELNPAPCVVKTITIKNINGATSLRKGVFKIPDGEFIPSSSSVQYSRTMDNFPDNSYFGAMVFPSTIAANEVVVEFLVDDQTYTLQIPAIKWNAGYVNLYSVRFTPIRAELVGDVQIKDWKTGADINFEIN